MKELRTVFPYGLNERSRGHDQDLPVGKLFPSIRRNIPRTLHSRNNRNNHNVTMSYHTFFSNFDDMTNSNIMNAYYKIRTILNRQKKKTLKRIAAEIMSKGPLTNFNAFLEQYYIYTLDIIKTLTYRHTHTTTKKTPKHICSIFFDNKTIELIRLPSRPGYRGLQLWQVQKSIFQ